jgi:hypothetical protein
MSIEVMRPIARYCSGERDGDWWWRKTWGKDTTYLPYEAIFTGIRDAKER